MTEGEIKCYKCICDKHCCSISLQGCLWMLTFEFLLVSLGVDWFCLAYLVYLWTWVNLPWMKMCEIWQIRQPALICCPSLLTMFTFMRQIRLKRTLHPEFLRAFTHTLEFTVKNSCVGSFASWAGVVCWTLSALTPPQPLPMPPHVCSNINSSVPGK